MAVTDEILQYFESGIRRMNAGQDEQARRNFRWIVDHLDAESFDSWKALARLDGVASPEQIERMHASLHNFGELLDAVSTSLGWRASNPSVDPRYLLDSTFETPLLGIALKLCSESDVLLAAASQAVMREDYDEAVRLLDTVPKVTAATQLIRASVYHTTRRWPEVITHAHPALTANYVEMDDSPTEASPGDDNADYKIRAAAGLMSGEARLCLDQLDTGIELLRRASGIKGTPESDRISARCMFLLGLAHRQLGDEGKAQEKFSESSAKLPDPAVEEAKLDPTIRLTLTSEELIDRRTSPWDHFTEPDAAEARREMEADSREDVLSMARKELRTQIGLLEVKKEIDELERGLRFDEAMRKRGKAVAPTTMHMVFAGPPGTGKTTIARVVAALLYAYGVTAENKLIEVSRADLVGTHVGQSAPKTREVCRRADGGVLFFDEAYALIQPGSEGSNDFGPEARDEFLAQVDNRRKTMVVILAGYRKEMEDFLATNPGLRSRFPRTINFPSYSPEEIAQICDVAAAKVDEGEVPFTIADEAVPVIIEGIAPLLETDIRGRSKLDVAGNGRFARNLTDAAKRHHRSVLGNMPMEELDDLPDDVMTTLTADDFRAALKTMLATLIAPELS